MRLLLPLLAFAVWNTAWAQDPAVCLPDSQVIPGAANIQQLNNAIGGASLDLEGCGSMIKSADEIQFLHSMDSVDEKYWQGDMTADQWAKERTAVRKRFNPKSDPNLDKLLAVGITAVDKQHIQQQIALAALDDVNGHSLSDKVKKRIMDISGLTAEQLNGAIAATGAPFKGYVKSLQDAGVAYNSKGHNWDLTQAKINVQDLQKQSGKPTLKSALGLFLSKDAMTAISDPARQQPIPFPGPGGKKLVILPPSKFSSDPSKNGQITVVTEDQYNKGLSDALEQYKDSRGKFIVASKASSSMWDFVKNQGLSLNFCWGGTAKQCARPIKANDQQTAAQIETNKDYMGLMDAEKKMINLGAPKPQLNQLQQDLSNVMKQDSANIDNAIKKIDASIGAAVMAERALAVYALTAGLGELATGSETAQSMKTIAVLARLARNGAAGFEAMAKFPIYLAGASSAYNAIVDKEKFGGSFMCHFAEHLAEEGPGAVNSAVKYGLLGAGGAAVAEGAAVIAYAGKGMEAAKAVQVGTQVGQGLQKAVGGVFATQMVYSGVTSLGNCGMAIQANSANQDQNTKVVSSADAWKACGQAPIDAYFAYQGGKDMVHSGADFVAGAKTGDGFVDSVKQGGKAYFQGAPAVTVVADIDVSKPERVQASINAIASKPNVTFDQDLAPVAQRLAKEAKPKDLMTLLQDPNPAVNQTAAAALAMKGDPESAKLLIKAANQSPSIGTSIKTYASGKTVGLAEKLGITNKTAQHILLLDPIKEHLAQVDSLSSQAKGVLRERATTGDPDAQKYVFEMANSKDPATQDAAIATAMQLGQSDQFTTILRKGLADKDTKAVAAKVLSTYDNASANDAISDLISKKPAPSIINDVVQNLRARQDAEAKVLLKEAAKSDDPLTRALAKTGNTELTKPELTAYNKFRYQDAKQRGKDDVYTTGDKIVDKKTGRSFTLVNGGYDKQGYYYVGTEDGTGKTVWFTDADLKNGKSSVKVVKAAKAEPVEIAETKLDDAAPKENGMVHDTPADGADPETMARIKSDPVFKKTTESLTDKLTKIADKLSWNKKYSFEVEDGVLMEKVVKGLKPREIETLVERLKADPKKMEDVLSKAGDNCNKPVARQDWDPTGVFKGVLYANNTISCEL